MKRYDNFKRKVLEVAKEQINAKTDLEVDYKEIKTGRKVTGIEWTIRKRAGHQMTIMDVSKAQIDTEKPWVKAKRAKREKGQQIADRVANATLS